MGKLRFDYSWAARAENFPGGTKWNYGSGYCAWRFHSSLAALSKGIISKEK